METSLHFAQLALLYAVLDWLWRDRQDFFRQAPDVIGRRIFGAQLDQVAAAVAKLLRDEFRRAAMQIGRVHERVKFAIREQFHGIILTANHAKDTKEFSRRTIPALFMGEIFAAKRSPEFSSSVRRDMVAVRLDYAAPEQSFFN